MYHRILQAFLSLIDNLSASAVFPSTLRWGSFVLASVVIPLSADGLTSGFIMKESVEVLHKEYLLGKNTPQNNFLSYTREKFIEVYRSYLEIMD